MVNLNQNPSQPETRNPEHATRSQPSTSNQQQATSNQKNTAKVAGVWFLVTGSLFLVR